MSDSIAPYRRLYDLATAQVAAVEAEDFERYEVLGQQRDQLMLELDLTRRDARPLLEATFELDKRCRFLMGESLRSLRLELAQLQQGRRAARTYGGPSIAPSNSALV